MEGSRSDPGPQLRKVLEFKERVEREGKLLFKSYAKPDEFAERLEEHLAQWKRDHARPPNLSWSQAPVTTGTPTTAAGAMAAPTRLADPSFDYWIAQAYSLMDGPANYSGALFCIEKALTASTSPVEWARAEISLGIVHVHLNNMDQAIAAFAAVAERPELERDSEGRGWRARALFNKGVTLGQLGRSEEEIAVYDDVLARFGTATELPLREPVAKTLAARSAPMIRARGFITSTLGRNQLLTIGTCAG